MNLESLLHNSRFNQMRGKKDNFIAPNVLLWIRPRFHLTRGHRASLLRSLATQLPVLRCAFLSDFRF